MTLARKCDLCDSFFESVPKRTITLDVKVSCESDDNTDTYHTWSDVDFCVECSEKIIKLIGPALVRLPDIRNQSKET